MARVVKKVKKTKINKDGKEVSSSNLPKILGSVIGGILAIGLVVGLIIFFQSNSIDEKYKKSRSMDYDTLVNVILENDKDRTKYEKDFYVLVFHSDYETYPDNVFSSSTENKINSLINKDAILQGNYDDLGVSDYDRLGFYTLDLMDEDNEGILSNTVFGNKEAGPFIIKISGTSVDEVKSSSLATYINKIIEEVDTEISKNQDK